MDNVNADHQEANIRETFELIRENRYLVDVPKTDTQERNVLR